MKKKEDGSKEECLKSQAVIVSGPFEGNDFYLSREDPVGLYPVVDAPILEYVFSFLESNGIEETIVFCTENVSKIRSFVCERKQGKMSIVVLKTEQKNCHSIGDVFRELDRRYLVAGDFVLLYESHLCSFDLRSVLETHRKRRKTNRSTVATFLLKRATFPDIGSDVFVLNEKENRILYQTKCEKTRVVIPRAVLKKETSFFVSNDLFNTGVLIGTPEMLALFTDNFDHFSIESFLIEVLTSVIVSYEIAASIIENTQRGYVQQANKPFFYQKSSLDIISRRLLPFTPDFMMNCSLGMNYVYTSDGSKVETQNIKDCYIGKNVLIGSETKIRSSAIGKNCVIEGNVSLFNVFLFDGVAVKEDVQMKNCIVESGVVVSEKNHEGCFCSYLGEGVVCTIKHEEDSMAGYESEIFSPKEGNVLSCELYEMALDTIEGNRDVENAILELGSLRLALNETNENCLSAVVSSIMLSECFQENKTAEQLRFLLNKWHLLIERFIDKETVRDVLDMFLNICCLREDLSSFFGHSVIALYEEDLLDEAIIVEWYRRLYPCADEQTCAILSQIEHFVVYLEESD